TPNSQSPSFDTSGLTAGSYEFRVIITDSTDAQVTSSVTVQVNAALVAPPASASSTTVDIGQPIGLSVSTPTTGTPSYTYEWQISTDGGTTWSDIPTPNSQSPSFDTSGLTAGSYEFRVIITDSTDAQVTSSVTVAASQLTITV